MASFDAMVENLLDEKMPDGFTYFSHPCRWYDDVLRGLCHFARAGAPRDPRLQDAVGLQQRRRKDGRWLVQHKHGGRVFFDMEKTGAQPLEYHTMRSAHLRSATSN